MVKNDEGIVKLKHHIMEEVCRLAWKGEITHEGREKIVYEVSPGPKAEYRCCVYKERAIIGERIKLGAETRTGVEKPRHATVHAVAYARDENRHQRVLEATLGRKRDGCYPGARRHGGDEIRHDRTQRYLLLLAERTV